MTVSGDASQVAKGGLFEDFIDVFVRPSALFERVRNDSFVKPALIQSIICLVLVLGLRSLVSPFMDAEFERNMVASNGGQPMPENAVAAARKMASIMGVVGPVLAPWFIAIIGGVVTWIASRMLGPKLAFRQAATIASWSYTPALLGFIAMAVIGLTIDPNSIRSVADGQLGPARFLDPATASPVVFSLLTTLELFSIWGLVLTAIGVAVIGRTSMSTGAVVAVVRWAIMALFIVVPALLR